MIAHPWWLAARASGLVALVLVTASVIVGLVTAARLPRRPGSRGMLVTLHQQLATASLVAVAGHALTLLADGWLHPGITGVTVPFALGYRRVFTGLGVVAAYLAATLGLSFHARRWIGARRWRSVHRATVVAYVLIVVHALGAGTDRRTPWLTGFVAASVVVVLVLLGRRLLGGRRAPVAL